jgi:hypothetical protein
MGGLVSQEKNPHQWGVGVAYGQAVDTGGGDGLAILDHLFSQEVSIDGWDRLSEFLVGHPVYLHSVTPCR